MNDSNQEPWNSSQGSDGGDSSRPENSGNSPSEEPAAVDEKQAKQPKNGQEAGSSTEEGKSPAGSGEPDAGQKQQGGPPPYARLTVARAGASLRMAALITLTANTAIIRTGMITRIRLSRTSSRHGGLTAQCRRSSTIRWAVG